MEEQKKTSYKINKASLATSLTLGFFLAYRQIKRGSLGTTLLIVFIMTLTFLNLVFVSGILVGLVQGASLAHKKYYSGDVIISNLNDKPYIEDSPSVESLVENISWTESATYRYVEGSVVEAGYKTRTDYSNVPNEVKMLAVGINPTKENVTTSLSEKIKEGSFLSDRDDDKVMIGSDELFQYQSINTPGLKTLRNTTVGSKVRITIKGNIKEFTVKGIIKSKVGEIDNRIYMLDTTLRDMAGRTDNSINEIAIKLKDTNMTLPTKDLLLKAGIGDKAQVQTWQESQPKLLQDITTTFDILSAIVGSIGIIVASTTIFIVIFINAFTRRKFIGILRGIGVDASAIETSYVLQSIFYAVTGTLIGSILLFAIIQPAISSHPIDFPLSDGVLAVTALGTVLRIFILMLASLIAGYIPIRFVVRNHPLDAILGR